MTNPVTRGYMRAQIVTGGLRFSAVKQELLAVGSAVMRLRFASTMRRATSGILAVLSFAGALAVTLS
jgi:hypothetical protein